MKPTPNCTAWKGGRQTSGAIAATLLDSDGIDFLMAQEGERIIDAELVPLRAEDLLRFQVLQTNVVRPLTESSYAKHGSAYKQLGRREHEVCPYQNRVAV